MGENITLTETDKELPKHVKNGFMRYRDFQPLTQGGEAILRTCVDDNLGRTVVMKTLQPQFQNLDTYQKRFLREARVTAQIPHPATIPVYELSRDSDGNPYFTMKKLTGRDLCDILDQIAANDEATVRKFSRESLLRVLIQVGQCLAFSHARGVVHRDMKPANIMIGDYGEIMVLDWGLAKVWDMPEEDDDVAQLVRGGQQRISGRLTGKGDVQGTPFYMSPEQATETGNVDERTDIYNMGIILFELLTGDSYMSGRNFREIKRKILDDPVREPVKVAPRRRISRELNAVCRKALQKKQEDRYQSMTEMIEDLQTAMDGGIPKACGEQAAFTQFRLRLSRFLNPASGVSLLLGILLGLIGQLLFRWIRS